MPYKAEKNGENYDVVNSETGEVKETHEPPNAKEKAERQVDLLNTVEKDPEWDKES